jgi:predicted ATP-dependent endonuclease of OLD family
MWVSKIQIENVRQFENAVFSFSRGFNLLVGGNGSGKSTLLHSLMVSLGGRATNSGKRAAFSDDDIRLNAEQMRIETLVTVGGQITDYCCKYEKRIRQRAKRPSGLLSVPVVFYESNSALSRSLQSKGSRKVRFDNSSHQRATFDFLHSAIEHDAFAPSESDAYSYERFGNSNEVKRFVLKALHSISDDLLDFDWSFRAYDCTVSGGASEGKNQKEIQYYQKSIRSFLLRSFESNPEILEKLDQKFVRLASDGRLVGFDDGRIFSPKFDQILRTIFGEDDEMLIKQSEDWVAELKLTPEIVVKTSKGDFPISKLSDGEQRLFSLFVDIARVISISNNDIVDDESMIIFIDEIDVHLHPKWQRKIAPILESLFPNCQFIATTHSPFVIQSVPLDRVQEVTKEGGSLFNEEVTTIDDIAEEIQGIEMPQRSLRAEALNDAAERYFGLLRDSSASEADLKEAEEQYRQASEPFSRNPAVDALLRVEKIQARNER